MLQNAYFLAKIGADTAENEQHLPKFCQKLATTRRGAPVAVPPEAPPGLGPGPRGLPAPHAAPAGCRRLRQVQGPPAL